ncbi:19015_t:CDS:1 [Funneliformis geosporum]|uniref:12241_t:CDS:1 n=1 Tax=Funneliformis geosporum TaxID=1117311 RepID=A0A9W4SZG6_9GLOM|nr:12241_t:CDS:1 [Funneliformis geosporum]CAI2187542.1 19015_t:CDS:1 [Funneliformis geosporum]
MCQYDENDDKYVYNEDCLENFTQEVNYIAENDGKVKTEKYVPGTTYKELTIADEKVSSNQSNDHHPGFFQKTSTKVFFTIAIIFALIIGIIIIYYIKRKRRRRRIGAPSRTPRDRKIKKKGGKIIKNTPHSMKFLGVEDPPLSHISTTSHRDKNIKNKLPYIPSTGTTTPSQVPSQTSQTPRSESSSSTQDNLTRVNDYFASTTLYQNKQEGSSQDFTTLDTQREQRDESASYSSSHRDQSPRGRPRSLDPTGRVPLQSRSPSEVRRF